VATSVTSVTGRNLTMVNCTSMSTSFTNDVEAFLLGYAVISPLSSTS
jgi:hypothetical protein